MIFVTFILVVALSRGETYSVSGTDYNENVDPEFPDNTSKEGIDNILYDTNGDINIILTIILWIVLTLTISFFAIKEIISEHALSGKCIAKKKDGEGYCSREQLPGELYCKQHLEKNRFREKKQG
ncbi:MAG: hypothetical protein HOI28_07555 [Euryarchaeota archaeon]|jgi:hypothetical protein|nr:hypothetical protein [Euryarchaeota archaeon]MBT4925052.1 hypothetical protein [Euryarchaeota archaeon]MBT5736675.1 hypothetical protein [Euryarchaeota archaeon]